MRKTGPRLFDVKQPTVHIVIDLLRLFNSVGFGYKSQLSSEDVDYIRAQVEAALGLSYVPLTDCNIKIIYAIHTSSGQYDPTTQTIYFLGDKNPVFSADALIKFFHQHFLAPVGIALSEPPIYCYHTMMDISTIASSYQAPTDAILLASVDPNLVLPNSTPDLTIHLQETGTSTRIFAGRHPQFNQAIDVFTAVKYAARYYARELHTSHDSGLGEEHSPASPSPTTPPSSSGHGPFYRFPAIERIKSDCIDLPGGQRVYPT